MAHSTHGIVISQRQYTLQLLENHGFLNSKLVKTTTNPGLSLRPDDGELL